MIVLYPLVVIAVGVILWRNRSAAADQGWAWFAAWSLAGALFTVSFLSGFSIGLFILPFAAATLIWVARRAPGRETIGFLEGIGAVLLLIAFLNRDYNPCPPGGLTIPPGAPAGTTVSCGGVNPYPWLLVGLLVSACAVLAYGIVRRTAT